MPEHFVQCYWVEWVGLRTVATAGGMNSARDNAETRFPGDPLPRT